MEGETTKHPWTSATRVQGSAPAEKARAPTVACPARGTQTGSLYFQPAAYYSSPEEQGSGSTQTHLLTPRPRQTRSGAPAGAGQGAKRSHFKVCWLLLRRYCWCSEFQVGNVTTDGLGPPRL